MRRILTLFVGSLAIATLLPGCASADDFSRNSFGYLAFVDENQVILDGHDPVAFFTENRPVRGSATHQARYMGATYYFASADNRETFLANPAKYAPQFGAFCSMAVSMGKLEPTDVNTFSIVDGRLLLQRNEKAVMMWSKDVKSNLERADQKWFGLFAKTPASR